MPTNAMGREAKSPGKGTGGGGRSGSNADKDRKAARDLRGVDSRPRGDHPGRVGGEQAQAASSVGAPSVDRFKDARNALGGRIRDEADLGNTNTENAANMVADFFGVHELDPEFDLDNLDDDADWGFDVLGAVAGAASLATGFPLLGTIVSGAEELLGVRDDLSINLGTLGSPDEEDVLGSTDDLAEESTAPSGGDTSAGTAAAMGGARGGAPGIDAGVDEIYGDLAPPAPPKKKPPKPAKAYSNIQLGDRVSVLDMLGY